MSLKKREVEVMTCVHCNREKAWTDGFPSHIYAECWDCAWKDHVRSDHPPKLPKALTRKQRIKKLETENARLNVELSMLQIGAPPVGEPIPATGDKP